ncbi:MAG: hypothetical protein HY780_15410 [Chloroflexi bacterium]|nr:hypothetical protein [Chloroflexota bacterium]
MRTITILLLAVAVAGLIAFQKGSRTSVEGYLDKEQKILYTGGLLPESADSWHTSVYWRRAYPTQADIDYYVATSRQVGKQLLDEGVGQFYVGVTLRDYLPLDKFDQFANELGIEVKDFDVRATFPSLDPGERITFFGGPASNGKLNDPTAIEYIKSSLKRQVREKKADKLAVKKTGNPDAEAMEELEPDEIKAVTVDDSEYVLNGAYAIAGVVDAKGYRRLLKDKRVYNVDVTATVVYQRLKGGGMSWKDFADKVQLIGYVIFWDMENMGLDKFQAK